MEYIAPELFAKLEQRLKTELDYRRAITTYHGGDADPYKVTHIKTSQRVVDVLRETRGNRQVQVLWFGFPALLDFLLSGATYRIEPAER